MTLRFPAGGACGARVRWPPEVDRCPSSAAHARSPCSRSSRSLLARAGLRRAPSAGARAAEAARVLEALETAFVTVADRVMPAVVNVNVKSKRAGRPSEAPERPEIEERFKEFFGPEFFDRFFRRALAPRGGPCRRVGRDRRRPRLHPHQQPRGGERGRDRGGAVGRPEVQGDAGGTRSQDGPRRARRSKRPPARCRWRSWATPIGSAWGSGRSPSAIPSGSTAR